MPDAGGLVIASDHASARAYALLLQRRTGTKPVVVLSDDPQASRKIAEFNRSDERWMVAVRMVSEGVDIPRLAVGVYATSVSTALYFAQAIGRFVRNRRIGETASIFLPSIPPLLELAAALEAERDHVLDRNVRGDDPFAEENALLADAERTRDEADLDEWEFEALEASAEFDKVLFDGAEFGTAAESGSAEEHDFLGLPGLLDPEQVAVLLRQRQSEQLTAGRTAQREAAKAAQGRAAGPGSGRPDRPAAARAHVGAAPRAQRRGRGPSPPHLQAARHDPRRAAPALRGTGRGSGDRGPAARAPRPSRHPALTALLSVFVAIEPSRSLAVQQDAGG